MRKAVIASLVGGLVLVGAFFYMRPACACMTPNQYGRDLMREELDSIARLEQAWRASHHAFTLQQGL